MFLLLFGFWLLLNGKVTLELVIIGLCISAVIYLFAIKFLDFSFQKDIKCVKCAPLAILYFFALILEVIKSNLNILYLILSNKKQPEPEIVHFEIDLKNEFLRVIFANSITLTPGTITISTDGSTYTVHALRREYINGIENSRLLKILKKMEAK